MSLVEGIIWTKMEPVEDVSAELPPDLQLALDERLKELSLLRALAEVASADVNMG